MKALLFPIGEAPEMIDTEDFGETLGGETETLWPFENLEVCLVMLWDREELEPNRELLEIVIQGPFLAVGFTDDYEDIREEDADVVESCIEWCQEDYAPEDRYDPFEENVQKEESYGTVQIVDEETFYQSIINKEVT